MCTRTPVLFEVVFFGGGGFVSVVFSRAGWKERWEVDNMGWMTGVLGRWCPRSCPLPFQREEVPSGQSAEVS